MTNAVIVEPGRVPVGGVGTDTSTAGRAAKPSGRTRTASGHIGDVILGQCRPHGTTLATGRSMPASSAPVRPATPHAERGRHTLDARGGSARAERAR
jgi:hypothetical protein